jgi:hypothetical protein
VQEGCDNLADGVVASASLSALHAQVGLLQTILRCDKDIPIINFKNPQIHQCALTASYKIVSDTTYPRIIHRHLRLAFGLKYLVFDADEDYA